MSPCPIEIDAPAVIVVVISPHAAECCDEHTYLTNDTIGPNDIFIVRSKAYTVSLIFGTVP